MDFDQTQVLDLDEYLAETEDQGDDINATSPVGCLKVLKSKGFPETSFPVYEGDNLIGRDDRCNITIPTKPISKKHACIEVRDGTHLIYDCNSRNRTRRNKMFLKPEVRYELHNEDRLIFADVDCQYLLGKYKDEMDDERSETGSENGSESMLPESNIELENLEPHADDQKLTSSPKKEGEMNESFESKRAPPSPESKNLGDVSPVFCAETDSETDDEKDMENQNSDKDPGPTLLYSSQENKNHRVDSSFVDDQTLLYSQEKPADNICTLDNTLPATVGVETDTVPATPGLFAEDDEGATPVVLKRAVDVKCDPFKRKSTGNTLDYGLETPENPNFSRESEDTCGNDSIKDDLSREPSPMKSSENVNTDILEDKQKKDDEDDEVETVQTIASSPKTLPSEDTVLDDLMATQVYDVGHIPESPILSDEFSPAQLDRIEMSEEDGAEATQAYGLTNDANVPDEPTAEDVATQAYGICDDVHVLGEGTGDEMATQAYGLDRDSLASGEQTGDEVATQAYGHADEDSAPQEETGDKVVRKPTAVHVDTEENVRRGEAGKDEEKLNCGKPKLLNEYDTQATQVYRADVGNQSFGVDLKSPVVKINLSKKADIRKRQHHKVAFADTSDSDNATFATRHTKGGSKTDESSDSTELPSLVSLGISMQSEKPATDSEEDFLLPGRRSSRKRTPSTNLTAETTRKLPSIVIEGENTLSSLKRCYVECTPDDKNRLANKLAKIEPKRTDTELKTDVGSPGGSKAKGRGRRPGTRRQEKPMKRGRRGKGRRETDEANGETVEGDRKGELGNSGNSIDENKEEEINTSAKRKSKKNEDAGETTNSEKKSKLNDDGYKEMRKSGEKETCKKEKGSQKESKNKKSGQDESKEGEVSLNDEEDSLELDKKSRELGKKKSDVKRSEKGQRGWTDEIKNAESKPKPKETRNMSVTSEENERLSCALKDAETEVDVNQLNEENSNEQPREGELLTQENIKGVQNRPSSVTKMDEGAESNDLGSEIGIRRTCKGKNTETGRKSQRKSRVVDDEVAQDNVENLEEMDEKRTTRTKGRLGKRKAVENKGSERGSQKTGTKGKKGKREVASKGDVEGSIDVSEGIDEEFETARKAKTEIKEAGKQTELDDDIFKFDDHIPELQPARKSATKRQSSQASSASSPAGRKSRTGPSSRGGRKEKPNEETPKKDESAEVPESFLTPEVTVTPRQRSRRSSTSSETSSQGSQQRGRGRKRGKKGEQENSASPDPSPDSVSTPSKRTKLDPKSSSDVKVLFTGLAQEEQARKVVKDLGGEVVESVYECTHLVTDKVRRTVKFLCALSRGIPVIDKRWLQACKKSKSFIVCSSFTVKDKASEKQYEFSLERSLELARANGLLEGYQVHVTPSVVPKPEFMKDIIQCAKGEFQTKMPTSFSDHVLVISCDEDKKLCTQALSAGQVHTSELILTGVLRQELDTEQYKVSGKEIPAPGKKSSRRR